MRTPIKSNYTIYDQYKNIRSSFNLQTNKENIHEILYSKVSEAEICVNNLMRDQVKMMSKRNIKRLGFCLSKKEHL